uniref:(California timema) hypothetical protein n=1 Tax=Timema californicum TaxID=61474 RepID=A0A7R9IVT5_TIMCA|nr:unnamed protein product [Timema californicum]
MGMCYVRYLTNECYTEVCKQFTGKPLPRVMWYRNEQLVSNESTNQDGHVSSQIVIRNLGRADLKAQLKCVARNNNKTQPLMSTVSLDMNSIKSTYGGGRSVLLSEAWLTLVTSLAQARGVVPPYFIVSHDYLRTAAIKLHGSPVRRSFSFMYHMVLCVYGHRDSLTSVYQASASAPLDFTMLPRDRPDRRKIGSFCPSGTTRVYKLIGIKIKYHLLVLNPWISMPVWLRLIGPTAAPNNLAENTESELTLCFRDPSVLVGAEGYFARLRSHTTPFNLLPTIPQNRF